MEETMYQTFNEANKCPKCLNDDIGTIYREDSHDHECHQHRVAQEYDPNSFLSCSGCGDEHIDRNCRRCGFKWREEIVSVDLLDNHPGEE